MILDVTRNAAAQDMIKLIMNIKILSEKDAVSFAINSNTHQMILKAGYAKIAFDLWGHDNPKRLWNTLKNPVINLELDETQKILIRDIEKKEHVDTEIAICYFLTFTMSRLGFHI